MHIIHDDFDLLRIVLKVPMKILKKIMWSQLFFCHGVSKTVFFEASGDVKNGPF